jgi:hypothetical protein
MRKCTSEYPHELVKNCKRGFHKNGKMYCRCPDKCEKCVLQVGRETIIMHPNLYKKWQEKEIKKAEERAARAAFLKEQKKEEDDVD